MEFDPYQYTPIENRWFKEDIAYTGFGLAEFENPKATLRGNVTITVDSIGRSTIEMEVTDYSLPDSEKISRFDDLCYIMTGQKPIRNSGSTHLSFYEIANPHSICKKLIVHTDEGIYETEFDVPHQPSFQFPFAGEVSFRPKYGHYRTVNLNKAKYWVLPLSNFVSRGVSTGSHFWNHPINRHPLRFFYSPDIPDGLSAREYKHALIVANDRNNIIIFRSNRRFGFVEKVPDYRERERKLVEGETRNCVTAVMVSKVSGEYSTYREILRWLPIDFIHLLSLATGSLVGVPWIELRDRDGQLVKRVHTTDLWQSSFQRGHAAIDGWNIGNLLSSAPLTLSSHLRSAIRLTVKGSKKGFDTEDNLTDLIRALDALHVGEKVGSQQQQSLSPNTENKIRAILTSAKQQIQSIGNGLSAHENAFVSNIASRLPNTMRRRRIGFHEQVEGLLAMYNLHDLTVVDNKHYFLFPRTDNQDTLQKVIAMYRGRTIHDTYFQISDGTHDMRDIAIVRFHIHDMLIRIILKMLGYDGLYYCACAVLRENKSVDWVQPNTKASELGYK